MCKQLVVDLLNYIEQVEKLKARPAFVIPGDAPFVAYQHELEGLPELAFNLQDDADDIWLRIPRLQAIAAPEPDEELKPWITLSKSPEKLPELKNEADFVDDHGDLVKKSVDDYPEICSLFVWYVENQWRPWATTEKPRRKSIVHYNRLFSLQQAIASEGAETPLELVWGIGYAVWKKEGFPTPLKYPLLVQACEVRLNEKTFDLEVRPRDVEPRLEADCYAEMDLPGVKQLESFWRSTLTTDANRLNPFESSTYEAVLKVAVGHLDPTGSYEECADDVTLPAAESVLKITNTWVLFGRRRSGEIFLEDIKHLKVKVEAADSLPGVIRAFVERGDSTVKAQPEQPFRGLSSSEARSGAMELYFPMPYNDEQVSIVQKLHANDGVVVQGPPGTGKTHTIANVICHYLAQGKRVLVTAQGEKPLKVLQEKLPEEVRSLSVSLLSNDRDGMAQFERAIQTIADRVDSINPKRTEASIAAAEYQLNELHARIAKVDRMIAGHAAAHMKNDYSFQGRAMTPETIARAVLNQAEDHQWFDDEPPLAVPPFSDADINTLRNARQSVCGDLVYLGSKLPASGDFPAWPELLALHHDLIKISAIETSIEEGEVLPLGDARPATLEKAQAVAKFLDERAARKSRLSRAMLPWTPALARQFAKMSVDDPVLRALLEVLAEARTLEQHRQKWVAAAVEVPVDAETDANVAVAVTRLVAGKRAFVWPFGKGSARKIIAAVTVAGNRPQSAEDWERVQRALVWRIDVRKLLARWHSLSAEFALPLPEAGVEGFKNVVLWLSAVEDTRALVFDYDANLRSHLKAVFAPATVAQLLDKDDRFLAKAHSSLCAHLDKNSLAPARKRYQKSLRKLDGCQGGIVEEIRSFWVDFLGCAAVGEGKLQTTWAALQTELVRLRALRDALADIGRIAAAVEAAGATNWAERLRTVPATVDLDVVVPMRWRDAWDWRQAVMFLDRVDGREALRALFDERRTLTAYLARTYQTLVAEKTWLGVFHNSPDAVKQELKRYLNAIQAIGAGTGVRAIRHRRTARDAMRAAYQAVPCWVLPQWRVSESLPPEIGLFDLVVIDEASQSDIWALPALLRGKKVLVVGDHKQVSPSAIGVLEEKIRNLLTRFLSGQPFGSEMALGKSIYDLASVVFEGNSVMLKEHFRCVPAIIEFSNREFYNSEIKPLRVSKADERLDPPLVDVFVKGGQRRSNKDVNEPEAKAIVDEIKAILADPVFNERTIGVVTLQGTGQAKAIKRLLSEQISPVDIVARKIEVGSAPVFQGEEKDIMMISMVLGPGDRAAANRADMQQRFNVALSRARDRMYLFRSVPDSGFAEDTLNGRVIRHFKQPFHAGSRQTRDLRERCESEFEREMFDALVELGYRVEPKVRSGGYTIDFVVEGNDGRRLAIECDGDRYHGPEEWQDDMARQRVLERVGWTVWRCFAASFLRRREELLGDLVKTLKALGIEPLGADFVDDTVWVQFREVDPCRIEQEEVDLR